MKSDEVQLGAITFDPNARALTLKDGGPAQLRNKPKPDCHQKRDDGGYLVRCRRV